MGLGFGSARRRLHSALTFSSARPPAPHNLISLLPLLPFPALHIRSIGGSSLPIPWNFDHVLFGTLSVEIRHCPPLRLSSNFPRALPSALGPLPTASPAKVPKIYFHITGFLSHGRESKCHREAERKAGAGSSSAGHCGLRSQLRD